jgi:NAD-dependent deacetylase
MGIVVLTGAGISAESGIPTFRASDGLWENHRVDDVATPEGFARNPALVHRFYNERRRHLHRVDPNPAHKALARLEREYDAPVWIVTQNIDDLHERGGSEKVIHMHGDLLSSLCSRCGSRRGGVREDMDEHSICGACGIPGSLRPDVVWFGEIPYRMEEIFSLLDECTLFISIGTSGHVYPAAGFVTAAVKAGAYAIEVNPEPSLVNSHFHRRIAARAGEGVPSLVDEILSGALPSR